MLHNCTYCDYKTTVKPNLTRHVKNKHEKNINVTYSTAVPNTMYVGDNGPRAPTTIHAQPTQFGSGNIRTNEPTMHCESGPAEIYQPNTVPIEDYNKVTEYAHGWKNAYDNLNNQTGSGISAEEVHNCAVEAIRKWDIAFQKENEKNKRLQEELHYEKLAKEALPIHMNEKILNIISILRGVKKGDNMGRYPDEMIHCICEALFNIRSHFDKIVKGYNHYRLKHVLLPIKNSIDRLANPKYSLKKKRAILSKPQVGEGVFTALASFVIPALISMITKK